MISAIPQYIKHRFNKSEVKYIELNADFVKQFMIRYLYPIKMNKEIPC